MFPFTPIEHSLLLALIPAALIVFFVRRNDDVRPYVLSIIITAITCGISQYWCLSTLWERGYDSLPPQSLQAQRAMLPYAFHQGAITGTFYGVLSCLCIHLFRRKVVISRRELDKSNVKSPPE